MLTLDDLHESEVSKMLQFIYTGNVTQDWDKMEEVEKLLRVSKKYEITGLTKMCAKGIGRSLSLSTFIPALYIFRRHFKSSDILAIFHKFLITYATIIYFIIFNSQHYILMTIKTCGNDCYFFELSGIKTFFRKLPDLKSSPS